MMMVLLAMVILPIITLILGAMWGRAYERSMWQQNMLERSGAHLQNPERLTNALADVRKSVGDSERVALAIDALTEEVERLAEGQRFLTQVLAEREGVRRGKGLPAGDSSDVT